MKVTVCFGSVRVVVPCGSGNFLVGELIDRAITRYKKAICKPPDYWVTVHNLKSSSDGGILDPDDELSDVADDREQIIAIFEEQGAPPVPHNGGDGTSASSVGTSSPDIFQSRDHINNNNNNKDDFTLVKLREGSKNDVIVTRNDLNSGCGLVVRRGSEPALNNFGKNVPNTDDEEEIFPWQPVKRWSSSLAADEHKSHRASENSDENNGNIAVPPLPTRICGNGQEKENGGIRAFTAFSRNPLIRRSLANNPTMFQWLEAQQKQQQRFEQHGRKEPLGGSGKSEDEQKEEDEKDRNSLPKSPKSSKDSPTSEEMEIGLMVTMRNTGGPLGIHVVPDYDDNGRDMGLVIQGIEPGGRIYDDGRLHPQDRIIEINGTSLVDVDFNKAQDIFKQALQASEIKLRVIASDAPPLPREPPPTHQKQVTCKKPPNLDLTTLTLSLSNKPQEGSPEESSDIVSTPTDSGPSTSTPTSKSSVAVTPLSSKAGSLPESPSKKAPPAVPARHPTTVLSTTASPPKANIIAPTNTKKIGKKIAIELTKGSDGLGFSVTTRDNPACGVCPIYIKNILPKGAAIQDGRLKPGDRLLEVNGMDMTGLTQGDAVSMLKATKTGQTVSLVVSRQVAVEDKYAKTKHLKTSSASSDKLTMEEKGEGKGKQNLALDIPLSDSGLGVSVKGKTTSHGLQDLGIFIKSVITGGAASKDGRLQIDDQIIEVNGETLIGKSNTTAMAILRGAMQRNCVTKRYISVVIWRDCPPSRGSNSSYTRLQPSSPEEQRISASDAPSFLQGGPKRTANRMDSDSGSPTVAGIRTISKDDGKNSVFANPLLGHLSDGNGLRNTSYQMATHDSLNEDDSDDQRKAVLEELDSAIEMRKKNSKSARPSSTIGFLHPPTPDATGAMTSRSTALMEEEDEGAPKPPDWLVDWEKKQDSNEPLSPEEEEAKTAFRREGFARQSMSEKRKNKLNDPRLLEFYQKVKEVKGRKEGSGSTHQYYSATWHPRRRPRTVLRGGSTDVPNPGALKRFGSAESILSKNNSQSDTKLHGELGPTLGLRKSSSLESLQSAVQEVSMEEDGSHFWKPPSRGMVRGRGCNESFRAAVDRSYENSGIMTVAEAMEPLEEEGSEYGNQGHRSRASSISNSEVVEEGKKAGKKTRKEKEKEKGGIFKGLGSMFRFGRHRKPLEDRGPKQSASEMHRQREQDTGPKDRSETTTGHTDKHHANKIMQAEQRLQEQYRHQQEQPREPDYQRMCVPSKGAQQWGPRGPPESRAARIQQLRAEHQQRHRERQGQYPHDEEEDTYEHEIQQWEKTGPQRYQEYSVPSRRRTPLDDPYGRMRAGRVSHSAAADLDHYSHYQNFHEIQKELRRHDYYQQQYRNYIAQQQAQLDHGRKGVPPPSYDGRQWDESGRPTHDTRIHSMQDLYSYGRQYSTDHLRQWGEDPAYRTRTGSSETEHTSGYPRSSSTGGQMPISQLGYLPYNRGKSSSSGRTSGTLIAPPQVHVTGSNVFQLKAEYVGYDPSWAAYTEPSYGSLPRQPTRDRHHNQNGHVSTSAQV